MVSDRAGLGFRVGVSVTTCQGVGLGNGVGVACWAALVRACSGFKVGVAGESTTRGVIFGAGVRKLQPERSTTKTLRKVSLNARELPITHDSNTANDQQI